MAKIELSVLRAIAKERGYSIIVSSISFGRAVTYKHIEKDILLHDTVFTTQTLEPWRRLFGLLDGLALEGIDSVEDNGQKVTGHKIGG